ncbi:hypothetical protein CEXT_508951 [Caerostris extrusa]|uniref:Uncharacterized protein n=1 Tax=Caerostris extrusa TaxID=172846 RepID=A0AAV4M9T2_CAEEX|nr:hypothetical protein CEXT_508951 [Caerostris extrusa]
MCAFSYWEVMSKFWGIRIFGSYCTFYEGVWIFGSYCTMYEGVLFGFLDAIALSMKKFIIGITKRQGGTYRFGVHWVCREHECRHEGGVSSPGQHLPCRSTTATPPPEHAAEHWWHGTRTLRHPASSSACNQNVYLVLVGITHIKLSKESSKRKNSH